MNILKRIDKSELFGEKLEDEYVPWKVFCDWMFDRFGGTVWIQFHQNVVQPFMGKLQCSDSNASINIYQNIPKNHTSSNYHCPLSLI